MKDLPRIPASAGALIFDPVGQLLILKPSYKKGWTIPEDRSSRMASPPGMRAGARRSRNAG